MDVSPQDVNDCITSALAEVEVLIREAFHNVGNVAPPGSALDQNGLLDGGQIVREYVGAGESGLALDHLIYMVHEPNLTLSPHAYDCIKRAGQAMSMKSRLWERLNHLE